MGVRIETNLDACRSLWDRFSPGEGPWDDWDLIFAFHDEDHHRFHFLVHEDDVGQADGLLPLVNDTKLGRYTLMGGSYPDGRILWLRHEDFPEVFEQVPEPAALYDLKESWISELLQRFPQYEANVGERDLRYYLVPAQFGFDFQQHLDTFSKDKRQKFLYDLRNIRKREPVLRWSCDDEADLFIELVNRNFGSDSDYVDADNANELRRTMVIGIERARQAVSLSLLHGNSMVALYAASNNDYNNLGKLLNVETINEACRLRVDEISFMTGMQWKADWKMTGEACVTLRKPPPVAS